MSVIDNNQTPILLAEDDQNNVMLIKRSSSKARIINPIGCVENGGQAIACLNDEGAFADRRQYSLPMLLDFTLPGFSGYEVRKWSRQQPLLKRLLVVVLIASRQHEDVNRAYELGANSCSVKPVVIEKFGALMQRLQMYWLMLGGHPDLV